MPSLGDLQLTTLLRGVVGPALPAEPDDVTGTSPGAAVRVPDGVAARARAAGAPPEAVAALVLALGDLDDRESGQVVRPLEPAPGADVLRLGTAAATQSDATTCGAAVLAMLAAAGDPTLAYWLVTGRTAAGHRPVELDDVDDESGPAGRFSALQDALQRRSNARAVLGALRWPTLLGTPPWGAARIARFPGAAFRSVLVDDARAADVRSLTARVVRSVDHGVPVPLYTGGDLSTGVGTAVPRHVVLVTARDAAGLRVYDPATARVHSVVPGELVASLGPRAVLGGWSHVCWALVPVRI